MDYKEKYENALEKARNIRFGNYRSATANVVCEEIFPELKESEDEMVRKQIISFLKEFEHDHYRSLDFSSWIAWLEKQCEQEKLNTYIDKLASDNIYNDENGNPIDKDLMAFASKVAFSMIPATKTESYHHLNRSRISDAVIKGAQWQKKQGEQSSADSYCKDNCKGFQETGKCFADGKCKAKREVEQKTAWSEEDEEILITIFSYFKVDLECTDEDDIVKWLKSIKNRVQPHWKPTDEQMQSLYFAIITYSKKDDCKFTYDGLNSLYDDLKKL